VQGLELEADGLTDFSDGGGGEGVEMEGRGEEGVGTVGGDCWRGGVRGGGCGEGMGEEGDLLRRMVEGVGGWVVCGFGFGEGKLGMWRGVYIEGFEREEGERNARASLLGRGEWTCADI